MNKNELRKIYKQAEQNATMRILVRQMGELTGVIVNRNKLSQMLSLLNKLPKPNQNQVIEYRRLLDQFDQARKASGIKGFSDPDWASIVRPMSYGGDPFESLFS